MDLGISGLETSGLRNRQETPGEQTSNVAQRSHHDSGERPSGRLTDNVGTKITICTLTFRQTTVM
ncbi:hypothetical protein DPMN_113470 [Dreissena polymorpha]|uniref:Uncharacterized protein n=1 Tax=Dreissena polymorpha TaxID=45954 RepID=A0A9D4QR11_DREPO|nr:hypothetical protein DPMN_113470 [Dreissena polymorpha]